ncbi:N-acetylglutamate synthase, GNAT family [Halomicrobium zhouii]|uniref:N-acetylglutamate synthase, GNAT family n=1 Tax=Halomicrobium zhouii TaxID=767519 RepID=A0A1I6M911_9EURY|nr:GNAT family N-acetyltransferase [Halomicrobium zhouii]SFS12179.1 N-acetylglutamate synthase, GNAT family [Halomicrobium zhouii]
MATARTIRPDELDELLTLYRMLNPDDPPLEPGDGLDRQWREMLADETLDVVVVEHDDRLVSTCVLSITRNLTRGARPFGLVENVVTREGYRGRGFGKRCLAKARELAEARDCYKVMLLTGTEEAWKHEFYERCGFDGDEKSGFVLDLRE